jgi:hypothetical protein
VQTGWSEIKPSSARPFGPPPWHADGVTVGWPHSVPDMEVTRTFGPRRTATDVVCFRQLSKSLARNVNLSSAQPVLWLFCLWTTAFL